MSHANFEIVSSLPDRVIIRDLGGAMSVTNDAEWVVSQLVDESFPGPSNRRLFYYDSMGDLDEIVIVLGKFYAFAPGELADRGDIRIEVTGPINLTELAKEHEFATPQPANGAKCARCGRGLKKAYMVNGVAYGPVCVRKLGFAVSADGVATRRKRRAAIATPDPNVQLGFFEEGETDESNGQ